MSVPGGDPIRFHADGRVENAAAGLAGTWMLLDDSTVSIGTYTFRHRVAQRDLFSPFAPAVPGEATPAGALGTRITLGGSRIVR